jgi:hypothetical protein
VVDIGQRPSTSLARREKRDDTQAPSTTQLPRELMKRDLEGQQPTVMLGIRAKRDLLARTHYYYEVPSAILQQSHLLLVV